MNKYQLVIVFFFLFVITACSSYGPVTEVDPTPLNEKIANGVLQKAEWVKNPESIVKELIPAHSQMEGNYSYGVDVDASQDEAQKITVTEDGIADDELSAERTTLYFKWSQQKWQITKIARQQKRG